MIATEELTFAKPTPRPYQIEAKDSYLYGEHKDAIVQFATGLGKTLTSALIFSEAPGRCLFLAHTDELVRQTCRAMLRMGLWPRVEKADEYRGGMYQPDMRERTMLFGKQFPPHSWFVHDKVVVSSMQTFITRIEKYTKDPELMFDLLTIDECFPAGTLVDGKPIETFRVGDSVTAFNPSNGATVRRIVSHVFRKPAPKTLVRITAAGCSVTATTNHPFHTSRGWVNAREIKVGDSVYGMFSNIHSSSGASEDEIEARSNANVLHPSMPWFLEKKTSSSDLCTMRALFYGIKGQRPVEYQRREASLLLAGMHQDSLRSNFCCNACCNEPEICICADARQQPNEESRSSCQSFQIHEGWRAQAASARWERAWPNGAGTIAFGSNGIEAVHFANWWEIQWLSNTLQTRPCRPKRSSCNRDRRRQPQLPQGSRSGQAKGGFLEIARVDSVEILQQSSADATERVCPDGFVYNLEVEGEHTYIANGFAVHNCHRSLCKTYKDIATAMREANPSLRLLGLTATPYRADKKNLGTMFPAFAYRKPIIDAIEDGYLVDVRGIQGNMKDDTESLTVGMTDMGRDITRSSLMNSMNSEDCIESIAHEILERGEDRKGIVFLPGIQASERVANALNSLKPGYASFVHGKVPSKERKKRVRDFEDNKYKVLTGCDVFVEGFDVPDVNLVVMARRTQSLGRYEQMLGRGLRPIASVIANCNTAEERREAIAKSAKPNCLVLDFVNNTKFKLVNAVDVLLSGVDPKKAEYVRKNFNQKSEEDRRAIREQLEEIDALYALAQALKESGGPPPKLDYVYRDVNLYGAGATAFKEVKNPLSAPTASQFIEADSLLIKPEQIAGKNAQQLQNLIEQQKLKVVGKKNYGFLLHNGLSKHDITNNRLNWHDAQYLRRLVKAQGKMPRNWAELVQKNRNKGRKAV